MRRWLCLATIVGLAGAVVSGCYRPPQPECGFFCGAAAECPADYSCNAADGRCHLTGADPAMICVGLPDAGIQADAVDADTVHPKVVSTVPDTGATRVGVTAPITVTFSEDVTNLYDTTALFVVQGGTQVPGSIDYDAMSHVATWTPTQELSSSTIYTANVTSSITDHAGNRLIGKIWTFTTADVMPPTLSETRPINAETGVPVNTQVSATFSEHVFAPSNAFTLSSGATPYAAAFHYDAVTHIATLTPSLQLPANTTILASLASTIIDPSGNPLVAQGWSFETGADTVPPSVVSTFPLDGEMDVLASTITVYFDEPVIGVTATSFTVVDQNAMPIAGALSVFGGGSRCRFTPPGGLPSLTTFTVTLTTAIGDAAGNHLPAPVTFSFTTG